MDLCSGDMVMGLNISIEKLPGMERFPGWDLYRNVGDREFAKLAQSLPTNAKNILPYPDAEWYSRPTDFAAWRKAIRESDLMNKDRFEELVNILEANPDYWIYYSY